MSHYKSNLRDIEFTLFEVLGRGDILGRAPFEDIDLEAARSILEDVDRLARTQLAASYQDGDRNPPVFDPVTQTAPTPESFKKSFRAWTESEFWRLEIARELGGTPAPSTLRWAVGELVLGSNAPVWMYGGGPAFAHIAYRNGVERDRRIAQHIIDRRWAGTMILTEPDAGSDVGAGRTRARLNDDGSWNIEGVKRFITSAESDLSENIVHFVLARPVGVEGAGGPGTKGLSLFLVPKYHFDLETGELTGERNGVYVTNVEHKMGIKVSNTCEVTFGDPGAGGGEPARGWLLGEAHDGIAQMFQVIENARMFVGTKAIATLSTGYLNALEFARPRIHDAEVRRSLMAQKSAAEAMRALVLYTASWQDRVEISQHDGEPEPLAVQVNDLLLPIVKGYGSERSWLLLGTESLQLLGCAGVLRDHPLEQYVRDAKIDTLYEGTTAIQGMDLFFRKIVRDRGVALGHLVGEIQQFLADEAGGQALKTERDLLATALEHANAIVGHMVEDLMSAGKGAPRNLYKVGLNTTRVLMVLGDVVCSWLLLRGAVVALRAMTEEPGRDTAFYQGKVAAARFFVRTNLPRVSAERAVAEAVDLSVMEVDEAAF